MPGLVHPSPEACESMSARLSRVQDLRLPAALLREHPYPEPAAVQAHLQELLRRDAGIFLERYGLLLLPDELSSFEPLRDNYEVDFYLKQAQATQPQQQQQPDHQQPDQQQQQQQQQRAAAAKGGQHLSSTVKNRRLAFMRRLEQQGEYFTEHAMREREPLVWQECIGRHEGHPAPLPAAAAGERGFAGSLLASYDEAMTRARLQQQMEDEDAAMSEHDSDSDEGGTQAVQQQQQEQQQQEEAQQGLPPLQAVQAGQQQQQVAAPGPCAAAAPTSIGTPAAASAGRTEAARAGAQAARAGAAERAAAAAAAGAPLQQVAAGGVDMGPGAMSRRRHEFLVEMQHRFLDGLDEEHQDYAAIDADAGLDEDWAQQQAQDAEDAYFDAE